MTQPPGPTPLSAELPPDLSLVVLAYEDAPALPALLAQASEALSAAVPRHEIVVVDDGSTDATAAVVEEASRRDPRVRLVRHAANRGVGAAFRSGVEASRGALVAYVDGDGQYVPEDLPRLVAALADADAASGVRVRRADPWTRTIVSSTYAATLCALYGLRLRDVNSGIKAYRRERLLATWPLVSDGPFYDAEVLVKLLAAGGRVVEVPVQHLPRRHGRARGATVASVRRACAGLTQREMEPHLRPGTVPRAVRVLLRTIAADETSRDGARRSARA
jgi:glycosyltransferase involved in cell wall biosynthesis